MLQVRRLSRKQVKIIDRNTAFDRASNEHDGVEGDERNGKIAGIYGDARFAGTEHSVIAIDTLECCAARTGVAFVAVRISSGVSEIGTPGSLHQVAAD